MSTECVCREGGSRASPAPPNLPSPRAGSRRGPRGRSAGTWSTAGERTAEVEIGRLSASPARGLRNRIATRVTGRDRAPKRRTYGQPTLPSLKFYRRPKANRAAAGSEPEAPKLLLKMFVKKG